MTNQSPIPSPVENANDEVEIGNSEKSHGISQQNFYPEKKKKDYHITVYHFRS